MTMRGDHTLHALRAALLMPWRADRGLLAGQLLVTAAAGLTPVLVAWLLRAIFNVLTAGGRHTDLLPLVVALATTSGGQAVLPSLAQYLAKRSGRAVERLASSELFSAVIRLTGLGRLEDPAFLDRLNAAQRVGMSGPAQVFTNVVGIAQALLTLTGFLVALLVLNPVMAAVVLAAAVPAFFAEVGVARRRARAFTGISHAARRQYFYANLLSGLPAAKEIRLFGLGTFFRRRMLDELRVIQRADQRVDSREVRAASLLAVLGAAVAGTGLSWAAYATAHGRLTVGDLSLFLAALAAAATTLTVIVTDAAMAYQAALMFRSYLGVMAEGPDLAVPARPVPTAPLRHGIEFDDVWFRYRPGGPWVLRSVCLTVPCGSTVALVGRNGTGKSTLVKLMCRFYDPVHGRILWDGVDLRDMDPAVLRQRISAVFQDYMTYELSARENIGVGDLRLMDDEDRVRAAARRAGVHDALEVLPRGYDTLLTTTYADQTDKGDPQTGVLLSGGQWQRVALARAFLGTGRDLVILDEPSSGLDAEAEYEIHTGLRRHAGRATTVLVSHRLNAIRDVDTIVVLADGCVAEQGDHDTLMALGGRYAHLFSLQSRGFTAGTAVGGAGCG